MLTRNLRQNLNIVVQIATKYSDPLGPENLIKVRAYLHKSVYTCYFKLRIALSLYRLSLSPLLSFYLSVPFLLYDVEFHSEYVSIPSYPKHTLPSAFFLYFYFYSF